MNKKIKLIKSFAGYPRGEYIFDVDENIYCWVVDKSNYKIHPDIVQWMPSCFAEVEEQRQKVEWEYYCANNQFGDSYYVQHWEPYHTKAYNYWNYYKNVGAAQAVSDLRKHVYQFPMCKAGKTNWCMVENQWFDYCKEEYNLYDPTYIHNSSTEEDRAERLRLINEVIAKVWYLTI